MINKPLDPAAALPEGTAPLEDLRQAVERYDDNDSETAYYDAKEVCNAARNYLAALSSSALVPRLTCLCGDIFDTHQAMFEHLSMVHDCSLSCAAVPPTETPCDHERLVSESVYRCRDCGVRGPMVNDAKFVPFSSCAVPQEAIARREPRMPHYGWPNPYPSEPPTFSQKLLAAIREALKHADCPECQMTVSAAGMHGLSRLHPGEDCRLGALLKEADDAGLQ